MLCIGITGGTGAGKTTALGALKQLNACIIDADAVYHRLTQESKALRADLERRFGSLYEGGELDRKKLGSLVFQDQTALEDLNGITHHYIGLAIDAQLEEAKVAGCQIAAIDAIGLLESGLGSRCDYTVAIVAPAKLRIRRIMAREGISEEYARLRVSAQKDEAYFKEHCDYVLENHENLSAEGFSALALALFQSLLSGEGGRHLCQKKNCKLKSGNACF